MTEVACLWCGRVLAIDWDGRRFCGDECEANWWNDDVEFTIPKVERPRQPDPGPTVTLYGTYDGSEPWTSP